MFKGATLFEGNSGFVGHLDDKTGKFGRLSTDFSIFTQD
jgi:hypothetical protein